MRIPEDILVEIFESIKKENNLQGEKKISHYLSKLKSNLVELRRAYLKVPGSPKPHIGNLSETYTHHPFHFTIFLVSFFN